MNEGKTLNEFHFFMTLPDHIKAHVLALCDFKSMMNLTETCRALHDLMFLGTKLMVKRVKLSKGSIDEVIESWKATERVHRNLALVEPQLFYMNEFLRIVPRVVERSEETIQRWVEVFTIKGSLIHELTIGVDKLEIGKILVHCGNLEKLCLEMQFDPNIDLDRNLSLPKLKVLDMLKTRQPFIAIFGNVRSLETLRVSLTSISSRCTRTELTSQLEDFILQQDNLKVLEVHLFLKRGLFTEGRLSDVKFRLKSFKYFFWSEKPAIFNKFLLTQSSSLKSLEFSDLSYFDISVLSRLETLKLSKKIDWNLLFIEGRRNNSVKKLTLGLKVNYTSKELEDIFKVLPNVLEVLVESHCNVILTMSSEKLKVLKFKDGFKPFPYPIATVQLLTDPAFVYIPDEPSNDLDKDSKNILYFIRRNLAIERVVIAIKCPNGFGGRFPDSFQTEVRGILPNLRMFDASVKPTDVWR